MTVTARHFSARILLEETEGAAWQLVHDAL